MIEKNVKVKKRYFKKFFADSKKKTLGEEFLHREPDGLLSAQNSSPRVFLALGEEIVHREF
jgi:hypothetical protein